MRRVSSLLLMAIILVASIHTPIELKHQSSPATLLLSCSPLEGLWVVGDHAILLHPDGSVEAVLLSNVSAVWTKSEVKDLEVAGDEVIMARHSGLEAVKPNGRIAWRDEGFREAKKALSVNNTLTPKLLEASPKGLSIAVIYTWSKGLVSLGVVIYDARTGRIEASSVLGRYSAGLPHLSWLNETILYVEIASSPREVNAFIVDASSGTVRSAAAPRGFSKAVPRSAAVANGRVILLSTLENNVIYSDALSGAIIAVRITSHQLNTKPRGLLAIHLREEGMSIITPSGETNIRELNTILLSTSDTLIVGGEVPGGYNISFIDPTNASITRSFIIDSKPLYVSRGIIVSSSGGIYVDGAKKGEMPVRPGITIGAGGGIVAAAYAGTNDWRLGHIEYRGCWGYLAYVSLDSPSITHVLPLAGRGAPLIVGEGMISMIHGSELRVLTPQGIMEKVSLKNMEGSVHVVSSCPHGRYLMVLSSKGYYLVDPWSRGNYIKIKPGGGLVSYAWSSTCSLAVYTRDGYLRIYSPLKLSITSIRVGQLSWGDMTWGAGGILYLYGETVSGAYMLYVLKNNDLHSYRLEKTWGKAYIEASPIPGSILLLDSPVNARRIDIVSLGRSEVKETLISEEANIFKIGVLGKGYIYSFSMGSNNTMLIDLWNTNGTHMCRVSGTGIPRWISVTGSPLLVLVYWAGQGIGLYRPVGGSCMPIHLLPGIYPEVFEMRFSTLIAGMNATYQFISGKMLPTPINDTFTDAWSLGGLILLSSPKSSYLWIPGSTSAAVLNFKVLDVVKAGDLALLLGSLHACLINATLVKEKLGEHASIPCISGYIVEEASTTTTSTSISKTISTTTSTTSTPPTHTSRTSTITTLIEMPSKSTGIFMQIGVIILVLTVAIAGYMLGKRGSRRPA